MPHDSLPGFLTELAVLMAQGAHRLRTAARHDAEECDAFDLEDVFQRLKMSTDTLREHGETWDIARILIRDKHGGLPPVVHPRARLAAFLRSEGCKVASLAVAR